MTILVYAGATSKRLNYACTVIFRSILQVSYRITTDLEEYNVFDGVKINYSNQEGLSGIQIVPTHLLFEKGIKEQQPKVGEWEGMTVLYPYSRDVKVPFDMMAATFYMCSRYEEYLPFIADSNGRFGAEESLAFQQGFLEKPVVDQWALKLAEVIKSVYPSSSFPERKYSYKSTIDIDSAFAYRYKGFMRTLGGVAKDLAALDGGNLGRRLKTIAGITPDAFDTYDLLLEWHREFEVKCIVFFLLADYGMNDKNVPFSSKPYQSLIKRMGDYFEVGIHPGYMSNQDDAKLDLEISRLAKVSLRSVTKSRQHFLMLRMPSTYRKLMSKGITEDYTMGFASHPGFRLGTCTPIPFYDLEHESITKLELHPFAVMDATLNLYMEVSPDEAMEICTRLTNEVKAVNGQMISLWHNESLSEVWHWEGWSKVYRHMLEVASNKAPVG